MTITMKRTHVDTLADATPKARRRRSRLGAGLTVAEAQERARHNERREASAVAARKGARL